EPAQPGRVRPPAARPRWRHGGGHAGAVLPDCRLGGLRLPRLARRPARGHRVDAADRDAARDGRLSLPDRAALRSGRAGPRRPRHGGAADDRQGAL
ncbi:MAG: hypothetical protein AVDCRST_MAG61-199, partial [uncultured Friedmanniella sp.]